MTIIEINTPDGPIEALLGTPEGQGPWPGVVVVHDAIGYGPDNESISRRIAEAGYLAITPNLYSRGGRARCPDAGHSFTNQLPGQPLLRITGFGYNEAAAEDAWSRVFSFFGQHLANA